MPPLDLDARWLRGERPGRRNTDPPIQVHHANESTVILRQSFATSYEAPFLYLLFGAERALLLDTGATASPERFPLRATVDQLIDEWLARHPAADYELIVAHSHAHSDHIAADGQFAGRPHTTIVDHDPDAVAAFFGIVDRPSAVGSLELGGRELTILAIPGHQASSIAVYDRASELLLTGDTVYPGRLYVDDFLAFLASLVRLCSFADAHPVGRILGAHIEMSTTPGRDYPLGSTWHPEEASLPMTVEQLHAIRDAAAAVAASPGAHQFPDFAIWNGTVEKLLDE
jgi:glyoxylase-like metal-dependent hydrolase (beta-lactamase superfamily II)